MRQQRSSDRSADPGRTGPHRRAETRYPLPSGCDRGRSHSRSRHDRIRNRRGHGRRNSHRDRDGHDRSSSALRDHDAHGRSSSALRGRDAHGRNSSALRDHDAHGRNSSALRDHDAHGRSSSALRGRDVHGRSSSALRGRDVHGRSSNHARGELQNGHVGAYVSSSHLHMSNCSIVYIKYMLSLSFCQVLPSPRYTKRGRGPCRSPSVGALYFVQIKLVNIKPIFSLGP